MRAYDRRLRADMIDPKAPISQEIAAVILAAGGSKRLGVPKQLVRYQGERLVRRAVRAAQTSGAHPVVVVLGGDAEQVLPEVLGIPGVHPVMNDAWETGLASSCVAGLRAVESMTRHVDGVLLMGTDHPLVDSHVLDRLIMRFDDRHRVVAASYKGTLGVPMVFGWESIPELMSLTGNDDARRWLRTSGRIITSVAVPEAAFDVDTPEDVVKLSRLVPTSEFSIAEYRDLGEDYPRELRP